jgi:hypothetical protein
MAEPHGRETFAAYNLFRLGPDPAAPIEMIERSYVPGSAEVAETGRRLLAPGHAPAG